MASIFISYRREEGAYTGRLHDRLSAHFGRDHVFMDIEGIRPGVDFVHAINDEVGKCDVVLAVIGRNWLTTADEEGHARLKNQKDYVRLELIAGIRRGKHVVPVLVGRGTKMPARAELPKPLQELAHRQAVTVSDARFHADVDHLIEALEKIVPARPSKARPHGAFVPFRVYKGHSNPVTCVAFSPGGDYLASGSAGADDCDVRYWKKSSGDEVRREGYGRAKVHAVAFSPDGKTLAIGSDVITYTGSVFENRTGIALWTLDNGAILGLETKPKDRCWIPSLKFSSDGKTVVAASGNYVTQWSIYWRGSLEHRHGGSCPVHAVAVSGDGGLLASGSYDGLVRIYRRDRAKSIHRMEGHSNQVKTVDFASDGTKVVSGSDDGTVRVWRVSDGALMRMLDCSSPVRSVAIAPDASTIAAAVAAGRVHLWRAVDYQSVAILESHTIGVNCVAFSPDSKTLASASDDKTVQLWALT